MARGRAAEVVRRRRDGVEVAETKTSPTDVVTEVDRQGRVNLSRRAAMQRHKAAPRD